MGNNQCIGKRYEHATQSVECIRRRKSETTKNVDETSLDCFSEYRKRFKKTYNPASKLFEEDFYSHKEAKFSTAFEGSQDIRSCKLSTKCNTQRTKVKFADQFGLDKGVQDMKLDISGEEESYHVEDPFLLKFGTIEETEAVNSFGVPSLLLDATNRSKSYINDSRTFLKYKDSGDKLLLIDDKSLEMVPGESLKRILEFHYEDQYYDPSSESEDELEIENDRLVKAAKDFISRVETSQDQYKIHELNQGPSQNQISCEIGFDDSFGIKNGLEEDFNDKQDHFKKFSLGQNIQRNNLDAVQGSHLRNKASLYQEGKSLSYIPTETSAIEKMNNSGDSEEIGNMLCSLEC